MYTKKKPPVHVTISTEMIGRGTHSVLHKESKKAGFKDLIAYLPPEERSLNQIKVRTAQRKKQIDFPMDPFPELRLSKEKKDLLVLPKQVPEHKIKEPVKISTPEKEINNSFLLAVFGQLSCGEILAYSMVAVIILASIAGIVIATWGAGAVVGISAATLLGLSVTGAAVAGAGMFATNTYTFFSAVKRELEAEPVKQMELKLD